jgi:hypothetical protein
MTYTKPEIREIGSAAELIQGSQTLTSDGGQGFPLELSLIECEE